MGNEGIQNSLVFFYFFWGRRDFRKYWIQFSEFNLRYFSFSFSRYLRILGSIFKDFLTAKFVDLFVLK